MLTSACPSWNLPRVAIRQLLPCHHTETQITLLFLCLLRCLCPLAGHARNVAAHNWINAAVLTDGCLEPTLDCSDSHGLRCQASALRVGLSCEPPRRLLEPGLHWQSDTPENAVGSTMVSIRCVEEWQGKCKMPAVVQEKDCPQGDLQLQCHLQHRQPGCEAQLCPLSMRLDAAIA